jgi:hypothetical protein
MQSHFACRLAPIRVADRHPRDWPTAFALASAVRCRPVADRARAAVTDLTGPGSPKRTPPAHMYGKTGEDPGSGETMAGYGHAQDYVSDAGQGRGCDNIAPR